MVYIFGRQHQTLVTEPNGMLWAVSVAASCLLLLILKLPEKFLAWYFPMDAPLGV